MAKISAFGTWLTYMDPDSGEQERIHYVADISGPEVSVETVDVTTHDSADQFAEFVAGSADSGEVTFDLMFDPNGLNHRRMLELVDARYNLSFSLILPQPDQERLTNPSLTGGTTWTAIPNWYIVSGVAEYEYTNPTGTDYLRTSPNTLTIGETYKLTVVFVSPGVGTTLLVKYNSETVGQLNPAEGGTQSITFVAAYDNGDLDFVIPAGSGYREAHLTSISLVGPGPRTQGHWDFLGTLTKCGLAFPVKDALKASVAIKVSGKPFFTASPPT
jgi:hypothetical protein